MTSRLGILQVGHGTTAERPDPVAAGDGAVWFDITIKSLIFSVNGQWV